MQAYLESYRNALSLNEYLVKSGVEYLTALSFPAIYFAKYL